MQTVATVVLVWVGLIPLAILSAAEVCSVTRRRRERRALGFPSGLRLDPPPRRNRDSGACMSRLHCTAQDRRSAAAATCRGD